MYLLALAYRTLDIENARRKQTVKGIVEAKMSRVLSWCKRLVQKILALHWVINADLLDGDNIVIESWVPQAAFFSIL